MRYINPVMGPSISRPSGPQSSEPLIEVTDKRRTGCFASAFFCAIKGIYYGSGWRNHPYRRVLVANAADRIRSDLADLPSRCAAGWNGSQSRSGPAGCSTQCTFLEFFVYPAFVYVAHRKDRRCVDVCDLLHNSDHRRQS